MRRAAIALAALFALAGPAFAGIERCSEPFGPVIPDAAKVTKAQLREIKSEVEQFIKDSDLFQECVIAVMKVTDKEEKLTPAQMAAAQRKIDSNQKEKEAIGAAYNELVRQVNARGN